MRTLKFRLVNEQVRLNAIRALEQVAIEPNALVEVLIQPEIKTRSERQNRYLWGVVYTTIVQRDAGIFTSDYLSSALHAIGAQPIDLVHAYCKTRFLPPTEGLVVGGEFIKPERSTRALSALDFAQYVKAIQQHAAQEWGIYIPDPHASYALDYFGGHGDANV